MARSIVFASTLVLAACAGPAAARPAPFVLQPGHTDLERGPDGNTVILDSTQGLLVIDTGRHPAHSQALIDHAARVKKPVAAIFNTHWHLDHSTGNRDLLKLYPRARLVTSDAIVGALKGFLARSREAMNRRLADPKVPTDERQRLMRAGAAMDDRKAMVPADPVRGDQTLRLGGRRIEVHLARSAVTEGDVWLVVPDEKLAIVGDLVVAKAPFFDTGCEKGWSAALDAIARAKWTTLIPGHGAPMNRAEFGTWRKAFDGFLDCARSDRSSAECSTQWQRDAAPFFTQAESGDVNELIVYYVDEVLRAPADKRMAYCRRD